MRCCRRKEFNSLASCQRDYFRPAASQILWLKYRLLQRVHQVDRALLALENTTPGNSFRILVEQLNVEFQRAQYLYRHALSIRLLETRRYVKRNVEKGLSSFLIESSIARFWSTRRGTSVSSRLNRGKTGYDCTLVKQSPQSCANIRIS